ncbi:MAG: Hsp20/alpha crystallin family protein [Fibrobacter sp.]|nr:Hsp20/alpha crystallin family protein [Fibrobacter sp.]
MINANVIPTAFYSLQNIIDSLNSVSNAATEKADNAECVKREYTYCPKADYYEIENGFMLEVELPGVKKEALDVQVEKNILTVKASRERKDNKVNYERSFRLAEDIDLENIQVALENGILAFTLTKKQQAGARKLNIA